MTRALVRSIPVAQTLPMRVRGPASRRRLATIMFVDMVASTEVAAAIGDRRWRELLQRYHQIIRSALKSHHGRQVDATGDGVFAIFEQPVWAVNCACALTDKLHEVGIEVRAGVHAGEVELMGRKVGGIAVHIGARIAALAGPGEVLLSGTVRDLVVGTELQYVDRGVHPLRGVPGQWRVFGVAWPSAVPLHRDVRMPDKSHVRLGSRPVVAGVAGGILLVAMVIGVVFIIRAVTAPPLMPAGPSIARIDVGRATFDTAIAVHGQPSQMAIGDSIWIIDDSSHTLLRVDLNTGELLHSSPVDGTPTGIAFGDGSVWVSSGPTGSVIRFDARTGDRQRSIRVPSGVSGMAYGAGSLWVADPLHDKVLRIDPVTNSVVATRSVGREPEVVAVGPSGVWVLNALDNSLSRIDPASNVVSPPIALQATATAVAVSADAIWLASTPGSITRIDPRTSQTVETLVVGGGPVAIAVAGGAVWVANYAASEVERIDLVSSTVTSHLKVRGHPSALASRDDSVWVVVSL